MGEPDLNARSNIESSLKEPPTIEVDVGLVCGGVVVVTTILVFLMNELITWL